MLAVLLVTITFRDGTVKEYAAEEWRVDRGFLMIRKADPKKNFDERPFVAAIPIDVVKEIR